MKIEIKERKENKLLGRLKVEGRVVFDGATPSNDVIKDMLAVELKADKNLIIVKHIYSRFSYQEADFLAYVYDNKEVMERMEMETKHLKKKTEEKKKEEKKAEEKPAKETPKEEKAEESKGESK